MLKILFKKTFFNEILKDVINPDGTKTRHYPNGKVRKIPLENFEWKIKGLIKIEFSSQFDSIFA